MIAINAFSQLAALASSLVLQTLYMILAARFLGPRDFGAFSFIWALVQILLIGGDLGLHNTAILEISGRTNRSKEVCGTFFRLKLILTCFLFLVVLLLAAVLPLDSESRLALVILGGGMFFHSLDLALNIVYQAHEKLYLASLNVVVLYGLQLCVGALLLLAGWRIQAVAWAYLIASLLALLQNSVLFRRRIHDIVVPPGGHWKAFARTSIPVGLSSFFQACITRVETALLPSLAGTFETGIFSSAQRIVLASSNVPVAVFSALLPSLVAFQERGHQLLRLFWRSLVLMFISSIVLATVFAGSADPLISLLFGKRFSAAAATLRILAWSLPPVFVGSAFKHLLLSRHHLVGRLPWITGLALALDIVLSLSLIPGRGSQGAALAFLITEVFLAIAYAVGAATVLLKEMANQASDS